jgi:hypothetical protein
MASCCVFNSGGCFCDPPNPKLSEKAKNWTNKIESLELTFESQTGSTGTLIQTLVNSKEYCGGDECGADCEKQTCTFQLNGEPFLLVSIIENQITFSEQELDSREDFQQFSLGTFSIKYDTFYVGQMWRVLCKDSLNNTLLILKKKTSSNTDKFTELKYLESKGPISYKDNNNVKWILKP